MSKFKSAIEAIFVGFASHISFQPDTNFADRAKSIMEHPCDTNSENLFAVELYYDDYCVDFTKQRRRFVDAYESTECTVTLYMLRIARDGGEVSFVFEKREDALRAYDVLWNAATPLDHGPGPIDITNIAS